MLLADFEILYLLICTIFPILFGAFFLFVSLGYELYLNFKSFKFFLSKTYWLPVLFPSLMILLYLCLILFVFFYAQVYSHLWLVLCSVSEKEIIEFLAVHAFFLWNGRTHLYASLIFLALLSFISLFSFIGGFLCGVVKNVINQSILQKNIRISTHAPIYYKKIIIGAVVLRNCLLFQWLRHDLWNFFNAFIMLIPAPHRLFAALFYLFVVNIGFILSFFACIHEMAPQNRE